MENEAKIAPVQYRSQMLGRLRTYKGDLETLSKDLVSSFLLIILVLLKAALCDV